MLRDYNSEIEKSAPSDLLKYITRLYLQSFRIFRKDLGELFRVEYLTFISQPFKPSTRHPQFIHRVKTIAKVPGNCEKSCCIFYKRIAKSNRQIQAQCSCKAACGTKLLL